MYCFVEGCRYSNTHLTQSHRCPCGRFGHGQVECGNYIKIQKLKEKINNNPVIFPENLYCTIQGCINPRTHTNSSHVCFKCSGREHSSYSCLHNNFQNNSQERSLSPLPEINRVPLPSPVHPGPPPVPPIPESPPQPSPPPSNPNKKEFYQIKCPSCRALNNIPVTQQLTIGHELSCIVCFDKANIFLPRCGHINICLNCVKQMDILKENNHPGIDTIDQINIEHENNEINRLPIEPSQKVTEIGENGCFNFYIYPGDDMNELKRRANIIFENREDKVILCSHAGMGCHWFLKRESINSDVEIFFMHGDNWGQYSFDSSDVGRLNEFVSDCNIIYPSEFPNHEFNENNINRGDSFVNLD